MARKKSRSSSTRKGSSLKVPEIKEKEKINAINTYEDVANSEDEFYNAQDKILFDADNGEQADELELSDEELVALESSSDEEDGNAEENLSENEELSGKKKDAVNEEELYDNKGWGRSAKSYYGGDDYDNEDYSEEDDEFDARMEEQEALRLQRKRLEKVSETDAIDDISQWADNSDLKSIKQDSSAAAIEELVQQISPDLPRTELLKILEAKHPEFQLFLDELNQLKPQLNEIKEKLKTYPSSQLLQAQCTALSTYISFLTFYFALLKDGEEDLKNHPIMVDLVRCKQTWESYSGLDEVLTPTSLEEDGKTIELHEKIASASDIGASEDEEDVDIHESISDNENEGIKDIPVAEDDDITLKFRAAKSKTNTNIKNLDDYGEGNRLDDVDAEDKIARKRSLKFYANQIDQKAAKRSRAVLELSGDLDMPYKERRFERQQRLMREAAARGRNQDAGADLDDEDPESMGIPANVDREVEDQDDLDYYESLDKKSKVAKKLRKENHDLERDLIRASRHPELIELGEGDKRGITLDIAKNRGLTPRRPKENRNPRLKKRMRYEKAKKKLASKKAIYKGAPQGGYAGEQTGIKAGLVKSIKLQ